MKKIIFILFLASSLLFQFSCSLSKEEKIAKSKKLVRRAYALYKQKNDKEAVVLYKNALKLHKTADTFFKYGNSLSNIPRLIEALAAYQQALRYPLIKVSKQNILYNMACILSKMKKIPRAYNKLIDAVRAGYLNINYIFKDSDLTNLWADRRIDKNHVKSALSQYLIGPEGSYQHVHPNTATFDYSFNKDKTFTYKHFERSGHGTWQYDRQSGTIHLRYIMRAANEGRYGHAFNSLDFMRLLIGDYLNLR